jgi:hypothetical protein
VGNLVRRGVSDSQLICNALFSQSQQQRQFAFVEMMGENMKACNREIQWETSHPAPPEAIAENEFLMRTVFDTKGKHHERQTPGHMGKHVLKLEQYFGMANSVGRHRLKTHFCKQYDGKNCCLSKADAQRKLTECEAQVFGLAFPAVTGGKMTMYQEALDLGTVAIIKHKVYPRALKFREKDTRFVCRAYNAGDLGANASDLQILSASRNNNIALFWDELRTQWLFPIHSRCNRSLERILRSFMGKDGVAIEFKDVCPHPPPR